MGNKSNAGNGGHSTRSLLYYTSRDGRGVEYLVVQRGSERNVDHLAANASTGHSTAKYPDMYDMSIKGPNNPANFVEEGRVRGTGLGIAWALRSIPSQMVSWVEDYPLCIMAGSKTGGLTRNYLVVRRKLHGRCLSIRRGHTQQQSRRGAEL